MLDTTNGRRWANIGYFFQAPMLGVFILQLWLFHDYPPIRWVFLKVGDIGASLVFLWCLVRLYILWGRLTGLITSGPFRFTRHPMYIALLLMNLCYWLRTDVWTSSLFLASEAVGVILLVAAGYCQERETLARFGDEAVRYYARTPRIPFIAPLVKVVSNVLYPGREAGSVSRPGVVEDYDPQAGLMMACGRVNPDIILPPLNSKDESLVREYLRLGKSLGFLFSMMDYHPVIGAHQIRMAEDFVAAESEYVRLGYKPISAGAFVSLGGWHQPFPETDQVCQKLAESEVPTPQGPLFLEGLRPLLSSAE